MGSNNWLSTDAPWRGAWRRGRAQALTVTFMLVLVAIEVARLTGNEPPIPFLLLLGSAALASALGGLRTSLITTSIACLYVVWAGVNDFGPETLTGGVLQVTLSCLAIVLIGTALGHEHDVRSKLLHLLRKRETELLTARERLTGSVAETTRYLERTRGELSDARYQMEQAMRFAPIGVATIDSSRQIQFINDAALALFGMQALPAQIKDWYTLIDEVKLYDIDGKRLTPPGGPVSAALRDGTSKVDFECRIVGHDGETRWSSGYVGPVRNTRQEIIGAVIMLVDATVQKEVDRALHQLTRMLFKVQEDERSKLSHELHEQIGQSLTAIKFGLYNSVGSGGTPAELESTMAQLDSLTNNIRQLSLDLRPTTLDDFGLVPAIETFIERKQVDSNPTLTLSAVDIPPMNDETATVAFRLVQEAVNNAIKHAQATTIAIRLTCSDERLHLQVSDNGHGFDVESMRLKAPGSGQLGLLFMQERVRQSGGTLKINAHAHTGTQLDASIPLDFGAPNAENPVGTD